MQAIFESFVTFEGCAPSDRRPNSLVYTNVKVTKDITKEGPLKDAEHPRVDFNTKAGTAIFHSAVPRGDSLAVAFRPHRAPVFISVYKGLVF